MKRKKLLSPVFKSHVMETLKFGESSLTTVGWQDGASPTLPVFVRWEPKEEPRFFSLLLNQSLKTILDETDRIAGKQRGVSSNPIVLRVCSPNAVPLTLVDTPGLTRIAVEGQPPDIESKIK